MNHLYTIMPKGSAGMYVTKHMLKQTHSQFSELPLHVKLLLNISI